MCTCSACLETEGYMDAMTISEAGMNVPSWAEEILAKYEHQSLPVCERPSKKAVIRKERDENGSWYVLKIDGSTIDRSFGTHYLRQLAWDEGCKDEDISFPDGIE